jgi:hypothetical protein
MGRDGVGSSGELRSRDRNSPELPLLAVERNFEDTHPTGTLRTPIQPLKFRMAISLVRVGWRTVRERGEIA